MKKPYLWIFIVITSVALSVPIISAVDIFLTISGKQPDVLVSFAYLPGLKREIQESEKILNWDIAELCGKLKCKRNFEAKVYAYNFHREFFAYTLKLHYGKVFISRKLTLNLNREELTCVLAHELGHALRQTDNEFEADSVAAETVGKKPCVSALTKIAKLANINPFGQNELVRRIRQLESLT